MNQCDLILKNAIVTTYSDKHNATVSEKSDVAVLNGKIIAINADLKNWIAPETIDLSGLHLFPGIIDSQVHFREPGLTHKEDIESGTRSALLGGVTTVFEMPNTNPPTSNPEQFQLKLDLSHHRAHTNYGFYIGATSDNYNQLSELENLPHCAGVKVFLGSSFGSLLIDDDSIFNEILSQGKRRIIIHAEDEARLRERKHIAIESGDVKKHSLWRDEESALIATKKSVALARKHNRPIHVLHVSSSEEMSFLKNQKDIASVEILPQYLMLSAPDCYERFGTLAQQNPPIRDQRHLEYLWKAVQDGTVDVFGSDHAPHTIEEKNKPYPQSPSGLPGVQTLLPLVLNFVNQGKLSLERAIQMLTENPARLLGAKQIGRIQVGYHADFTVVDLKRSETITQKWLANKSNWSPFVGTKVTGWPVMSFLNGKLALQEGVIMNPHSGRAINFN